jgi:anti-sigma regulatory factor (Ser/Thr protein kinase)/ActR/RegA family two-component response regulator
VIYPDGAGTRGECKREERVSSPSNSKLRAPGTPGSLKSLLVVSDPEINLILLDQLLTRDWAVEYVGTNQEAFGVVQKQPFDLIITSQATSAKEDIELLRKIRTIRSHTRMIIRTQKSTTEDVVEALRLRAFSYFSHPCSVATLSETIRMAMEDPVWDDGIEVASASPNWIRLLVRCDIGTVERLMHFFNEIADLPEEEKAQVAYALREMVMNAITHGGQFDPRQYVEVSYVRGKKGVACRVKDPGKGFTIDELLHAAVSNPLDDPMRHMHVREAVGMPPGGFGILLSRQLVDEVIYNEAGNEVLLVKYLDNQANAPFHA